MYTATTPLNRAVSKGMGSPLAVSARQGPDSSTLNACDAQVTVPGTPNVHFVTTAVRVWWAGGGGTLQPVHCQGTLCATVIHDGHALRCRLTQPVHPCSITLALSLGCLIALQLHWQPHLQPLARTFILPAATPTPIPWYFKALQPPPPNPSTPPAPNRRGATH